MPPPRENLVDKQHVKVIQDRLKEVQCKVVHHTALDKMDRDSAMKHLFENKCPYHAELQKTLRDIDIDKHKKNVSM